MMVGEEISLKKVIFCNRCPVCGKGRLFKGLLAVSDSCSECGTELGRNDTADGPAFFVMFVVSTLVIIGALILESWLRPPLWLHAAIWIPVVLALSVLLLRWCKAWMVAMEYRHGLHEDKEKTPHG